MTTRIDALQARELAGDGAQLADVLPRSIFDQEHLPGAISLPLESLDRRGAHRALDPARRVVVYCFDQH
jgi:rhodanese-related sulfurtransferase